MLIGNVKPQVVNPQGILLIGRSKNFNEQQTRDFESVLSTTGKDFSIKTAVHIRRMFEKFGYDEVFG
jgi:hypothetical protein